MAKTSGIDKVKKSKEHKKRAKKLNKAQSKDGNSIRESNVSETPQEKPSANNQNNVKKVVPALSMKQLSDKYEVFKNGELVEKFLAVSMTNNQKGRLRQALRESLKGTSDVLLPDVIHTRIQALTRTKEALSDTALRKIRILYNMLKNTLQTQTVAKITKIKKKGKKLAKNTKNGDGRQDTKEDKINEDDNGMDSTTAEDAEYAVDQEELVEKKDAEKSKKSKIVKMKKGKNGDVAEVIEEDNKEDDNGIEDELEDVKGVDKEVVDKITDSNISKKSKGPKRYVVFVGKLPLNVDEEKIFKHFSDLKDYIVNVRIPKQNEAKKHTIAYVELKNEASYEMALSKNHTMLDNKRITVHYTTQKNSKISKTEAKGKQAKLVALQKSGKLIGSVPLTKKRSQRRAKAKKAKAKLDAEVLA